MSLPHLATAFMIFVRWSGSKSVSCTKDQRAAVGDVGDEPLQRGGLGVAAAGEVVAAHLGQGALGEKREGVHGVRELAQGRALAVEPVVAEVVAPVREAGGLYLAQERLAQIVLLP